MMFNGQIWTVLCLILACVYAIEYGSMGKTTNQEDVDALIESYDKTNEKSLLWGPYRSNLYFGVRPRIPESLMTGLMWFNMDDYQSVARLRHECNNEDGLDKYGWVHYDPRVGGRQFIKDKEFKVKLTTDFVKNKDGNWAMKVKGTTKNQDVKTSVVFYAGLEGEGDLKFAGIRESPHWVDGDIKLIGYSERLGGGFDLDVTQGDKNQYVSDEGLLDPSLDPSKSHHISLVTPTGNVWKAKSIFMTLLQESIKSLKATFEKVNDVPPEQAFQMLNPSNFEGNLHMIQKTFQGNFEFDVLFNMELSSDKFTQDNLKDKIKAAFSKFDDKFIHKFQLSTPFNDVKYVKFAREIISQLLGGISYFYGEQIVDRDAVIDEVDFTQATLAGKKEGPYELFTAVPSRPFFPRGFYWDEGFHLLPILEFDSDIALEVVKSWFSLIDKEGWIAREQILGDEARSKVPPEFLVQNPNIANPPTLMMVFSELLDVAKKRKDEQQVIFDDEERALKIEDQEIGDLHLSNPELLIRYANDIYPQLQKHFNWFRRTQRGSVKEFERSCHSPQDAYRWKGRTQDHCLASGIDDYPRCDADIAELNVDLISWMGVMSRSMHQISYLLERHDDAEMYNKIYNDIVLNLEDLHWSEEDKSYCDLTVDEDDEDMFECHIGYVTLMPFIHKLLPASSDHISYIIKTIRDPDQLWSEYGIRSLSKKDSKFRKEEDYWRGNIWININYLVLEALQHYASEEGLDAETKQLAEDTYAELRKNLISNVYNQYQTTGFAWEQYNEETGEGQKTKQFLGWTSLVVLMMKMPETLN